MMHQTSANGNGKSIYEIGVQELQHVSVDDGARRNVDRELNEARGRETARLHVTLKSLAETDTRSSERARQTLEAIDRLSAELQERASHLNHLVETFEQNAGKQFEGVHSDLRTRTDALTGQISQFVDAERQHYDSVRGQVGEFRDAVTVQVREAYDSLATQGRESREAVTMEVKDLRDELVKLVDSRMNQADASFAALRGDIEVLKYLVMDIIKTRIGRSDPNQKPL